MNFGFRINICAFTNSFPRQPNPNLGDNPPRRLVRSLYYLTLTLTLIFIIGLKMNLGLKINICALIKSVLIQPNPNPNPGGKPPRPPLPSLYYLTLTLTLIFIIGFENEFGFENKYLCPHQVGPHTT